MGQLGLGEGQGACGRGRETQDKLVGKEEERREGSSV